MRRHLLVGLACTVVLVIAAPASAAPPGARAREHAAEACDPMVSRSVESVLDGAVVVHRSGRWRGTVFTCRYSIGDGALLLRVRVLQRASAAKAEFARALRRVRPGEELSGLGQQAFLADTGEFIARKDRFVIDADPSQVPSGFNGRDIAFAAGLGLLDCW